MARAAAKKAVSTPKRPLHVNLIPKTMYGRNVRAVVSQATWDNLRWGFGASYSPGRYVEIDFPEEMLSRIYRCEGLRCAICDVERGSLDLHEEWEFDDQQRVQKLVELLPLCKRCHFAKHLGYASIVGRLDEALEQLAFVNGWSQAEALAYSTQVFADWSERSQHLYTLDLRYLEQFMSPRRIHMDWLGSFHSWFGSRIDSVIWARRMFEREAVVIDTETTGLPDKIPHVEIIEVSIIDMSGKVVFDSLFRPSKPIPNSHIHGITDRHVKTAPRIADRWGEISDILDGRDVISYNARFEREVFQSTADVYGLEPPKVQWNCAMQAWWTFNELPYTKLPEGEHRALGDARVALGLVKQMAEAANLYLET